jgi:hypothetical protein
MPASEILLTRPHHNVSWSVAPTPLAVVAFAPGHARRA